MAFPQTPKKFKTNQASGSLETRPSPEVSSGAMRSRPFRKLVGGHDASIDPLNREERMSPASQVASNTAEMTRRQGTTNIVYGGTKQGNKLQNSDGTTQDKNAFRLSGGQKVHGRTMKPMSRASMAMKRKLRTAFGQGGTAIPTQSGNRNTPGSGSPMSVSAGAYRGPKGAQGQRAFNAGAKWTPNKGGHKATVSNTSIRPKQGSAKNV